MKLVQLRAENIKGLKAVELQIGDDDRSVVVEGNNGAGKSSLLDSIAFALTGKRNIPEQPLPEGEDRGEIELVTNEDYIIKRVITEKDSYLEVTSKEGEEYDAPQSLLNDMIGTLCADPYQLRSDSPRQIREKFLEVIDVDLDLEEWEEKRERLYDKRKSARRKYEGIEEELKEMDRPEPELPNDTVSPSDLTSELEEARKMKTKKDENVEKAREIEESIQEKAKEIRDLEERIEKLEEKMEEDKEKRQELIAEADQIPDSIDETVKGLEEELEDLEEKNDRIRYKQRFEKKIQKRDEWQDQYEELVGKVTDHWTKKRNAIEKADFPVDGLTLREGDFAWRGTPLEQLSQAERLLLYSALEMARNPELRCLLLRDASLLDDHFYKKLKGLAQEFDFQVFFEFVREQQDADVCVRIHEGEAQVKKGTAPVSGDSSKDVEDQDVDDQEKTEENESETDSEGPVFDEDGTSPIDKLAEGESGQDDLPF